MEETDQDSHKLATKNDSDRDTRRTSPYKDILDSEMGMTIENGRKESNPPSLQGTQYLTADRFEVDQ